MFHTTILLVNIFTHYCTGPAEGHSNHDWLRTGRHWWVNLCLLPPAATSVSANNPVDASNLQLEECQWRPQWTNAVLVRWVFLGYQHLWPKIESYSWCCLEYRTSNMQFGIWTRAVVPERRSWMSGQRRMKNYTCIFCIVRYSLATDSATLQLSTARHINAPSMIHNDLKWAELYNKGLLHTSALSLGTALWDAQGTDIH